MFFYYIQPLNTKIENKTLHDAINESIFFSFIFSFISSFNWAIRPRLIFV